MNIVSTQDLYLKDYETLQQAIKSNNETKSESAWVYDRYNQIKDPSEPVTTTNISKMWDEFEAQIPDLSQELNHSNFRLVPSNTFDSQEQINWLIKTGHFFYAKEV